jgi:hypothetical protein
MAKASKKAAIAAVATDALQGVTADSKVITKLIAAIATASAAQRERVRIAAVCAIEHAIVHGNANYLTSLYVAIGSESRRNSFIKWCIEFSPVRWIEGKKTADVQVQGSFGMDAKRTEDYKASYAKDRIALLAPLVKVPYWDWDKEPPFAGFSLRAQMAALIKKAITIKDDPEKASHEGNDFDGLDDMIIVSSKNPPKPKAKKAGGKHIEDVATVH